MGYLQDAKDDAKSTAEEFKDQIVEMLLDDRRASDDLFNDYPSGDSYHHESHVDRDYNLSDAAILLEDLGQYEETDSGLWDGQEPRRAIATQAAYTYGNAVLDMWRDLISEINDDSDIEDLFNQIEEAESSIAEVEEALGTSGDSASEDEVAEANAAISEYEAEIEKLKAALPAAVQSVIDGF